MKRKHFVISLIIVLVALLLILTFNKKLELITYSIITDDHIKTYESSVFSLIAIGEKENTTTYHIFLKRKNKVLLDNHLTYDVPNAQIEKMLNTISEFYESYTIISTQPHLRKWTGVLSYKALEENLYYSVMIEDHQLGWRNLELSFFNDEIIVFDGYKHTKLR